MKKKKSLGHYCKICGRMRAHEKFSGAGHAAHICKDCEKRRKYAPMTLADDVPSPTTEDQKLRSDSVGISEEILFPLTEEDFYEGEEKEQLESFVEGLLEQNGFDPEASDSLKEALVWLESVDPKDLKGSSESEREIIVRNRDVMLNVIRIWLDIDNLFRK